MTRILVTGATGNVGSSLTRQLLAEGHKVRGLTSNPAKLSAESGGVRAAVSGLEMVLGDLAEPEGLHSAVEGMDAVFLMWPLHDAVGLAGVLEVIKEARARVVFLGSGGVRDLNMDEQERLVSILGAANWTFIRPSTFAANLLWWIPQILAGDVVRGAFGDLPMALLHEDDIAAVAARALTDDGHAGATYKLTGPEVSTQAEQVRLIGEAIGRPLRWQEVPRSEARKQMIADGLPLSFVDVLLDTYAWMLTQPAPRITTTIEELTGSPARTVFQWAQDHATDFLTT